MQKKENNVFKKKRENTKKKKGLAKYQRQGTYGT